MMSNQDKYLSKFRSIFTKSLGVLKVVLETRKNGTDYFHNYFNTHKDSMKSYGLVSDPLSISVTTRLE